MTKVNKTVKQIKLTIKLRRKKKEKEEKVCKLANKHVIKDKRVEYQITK